MLKRILKIAALVVAIGLIAFALVFANALVGNPISKAIASDTAEKHLAEEYSAKDFDIERITYSFKDGYYHAYVSSASSIDSDFTLIIDMWGNLLSDSYEDRVLGGWNTSDRIRNDYRNMTDAILDSPLFPYDVHIGYGDIEFYPREHAEKYPIPDYAMITDDLVLDAFYDLYELGKKHGKLTVYIYDETVSVDRLSEILLDIKAVFDDGGVNFYVIDCVLEYPKSEDGPKREGRVEVMDFLYSDIYEDGMSARVSASNDAANAYYAEQDAEKLNEKL